MKKYGHSNDQKVTTEEEEQPDTGLRATASSQRPISDDERRAIIEGEE